MKRVEFKAYPKIRIQAAGVAISARARIGALIHRLTSLMVSTQRSPYIKKRVLGGLYFGSGEPTVGPQASTSLTILGTLMKPRRRFLKV